MSSSFFPFFSLGRGQYPTFEFKPHRAGRVVLFHVDGRIDDSKGFIQVEIGFEEQAANHEFFLLELDVVNLELHPNTLCNADFLSSNLV